jgi:MtN3 and saliva related transmembrane protein
VESVLAITAATWAIAMAFGPVLEIRRIVEHRSSRGNSVGYFLILRVGFALWIAYGVAASNFALIIPNTVAVVVITATIAIAWRYRGKCHRAVPRGCDPQRV